MTDIVFPPGVAPTNIQWYLRRNVVSAPSFITRDTQDIDRQGALWGCALEFGPLAKDKSAALSAWLDQISKASNCGLVPVFQNDTAGSFSGTPAGANLCLPWAAGEAALWTRGPGTFSTVAGRYLRVHNFGTNGGINRNYSGLVANGSYVAVFDVVDHNTGWQLIVQSGADTLAIQPTPDRTAIGRFVYPITPTSTNIRLYLYSTQSAATTGEAVFGDVQLYRLLEARLPITANQMGMIGDPVSTGAGQLQIGLGQFVNVRTSTGWELKRVVKAGYSIPSQVRNGVAVNVNLKTLFEPALRGTVAEFAPILHQNPWCRMKLATPESSAAIGPPLRSSFSIELIERLP